MPRKWIKLWLDGWLDGTLRLELTDAERAVWVDLLALAGRSRSPGLICAGPHFPYPHSVLAQRLGLDLDFFEETLKKFVIQVRIEDNSAGIRIINWDKYQNGYPDDKPLEETPQLPLADMPAEVTPLIGSVTTLPKWRRDNSDSSWIFEFIKEFPDFCEYDIKCCRDYHSARAVHDKGQWKNRLRNWMLQKHERQPGGLQSSPPSYVTDGLKEDNDADT